MPKLFFSHKSLTINHKSGFTLIELLVVIAIISILATLLMTNFVGIRQRGRDGVRKSDLRQIQAALEQYRSDNGGYPTSSADLYSGGSCPASGPFTSIAGTTYMQKVPCDPLSKSNYTYTFNGANNTYEIYACLENLNDSERDDVDGGVNDSCGDGSVSFTVMTP